jgi:hypothetical protein
MTAFERLRPSGNTVLAVAKIHHLWRGLLARIPSH